MKKILLANYKNVMSEAEMKMVKGGGVCGSQQKFHCTTTYLGFATTGYTCASGQASAQLFIKANIITQAGGLEDSDKLTVSCRPA